MPGLAAHDERSRLGSSWCLRPCQRGRTARTPFAADIGFLRRQPRSLLWQVVKKPVKKVVKKPVKKVVRKPVKKVVRGRNAKNIRNKGTPIDPAFSPEQIKKALGIAGQVQQNFGGQGIPLAGVAGVGVWILLILRYTIFYGFFGAD